MSSIVMYGNEYFGQIDNGLTPAHFKYRFLVEGDSWMDRSSMFHTSLLQCLAPEFEWLTKTLCSSTFPCLATPCVAWAAKRLRILPVG